MLDYGCGSGILAIAALTLGARLAYAVDNDPQALAATHDNAALNGGADRLIGAPPEALPAVDVDVLAPTSSRGRSSRSRRRSRSIYAPGGCSCCAAFSNRKPRPSRGLWREFADLEQTVRDGWVRITARRTWG